MSASEVEPATRKGKAANVSFAQQLTFDDES